MSGLRSYSLLDKICIQIDQAVRALSHATSHKARPYPADGIAEALLNSAERRHTAGLMRVNHTGEVAAQALYYGQSWVSSNTQLKNKFMAAALEEGDHLHWCYKRLQELNGRTSYLNPFWYIGSFAIGTVAGLAGDTISLGFLAETEKQVIKHLQKHLHALPQQDARSRAILEQMQQDEAMHREDALACGGVALPYVVKKFMGLLSKVMVKTAYWL